MTNFVVYHKETTRFLRIFTKHHWRDADYFTDESAAQAAITRESKRRVRKGEDPINESEYDILPRSEFDLIEKTEKKINLISKQEFTQRVNTPACCDPSTETYWSM